MIPAKGSPHTLNPYDAKRFFGDKMRDSELFYEAEIFARSRTRRRGSYGTYKYHLRLGLRMCVACNEPLMRHAGLKKCLFQPTTFRRSF
jgi:hypothetical protein